MDQSLLCAKTHEKKGKIDLAGQLYQYVLEASLDSENTLEILKAASAKRMIFMQPEPSHETFMRRGIVSMIHTKRVTHAISEYLRHV